MFETLTTEWNLNLVTVAVWMVFRAQLNWVHKMHSVQLNFPFFRSGSIPAIARRSETPGKNDPYLIALFQIVEEEARVCHVEDQVLHLLGQMVQMLDVLAVPGYDRKLFLKL